MRRAVLRRAVLRRAVLGRAPAAGWWPAGARPWCRRPSPTSRSTRVTG
ncbi:hypothetical protein ACIG5D_28240 [Microbispora rosea]